MEYFATLGANIALGLGQALSLTNLFYCFFGVLMGTFLGLIPGIGTLVAISLLFPITFHLDPLPALIMLAGIFYGSTYGGSTASILLNLPGTPANAVACLDGYPMSKQGRAGVALLMTTVASFVGATVGILLIMLFAPVIVSYALRFGPQEYFALMVLGLLGASAISEGSPVKGIAMVVFGIILGLVGMDVSTGVQRFGFGLRELFDGISLVALAMGLFGVAEVISRIRTASDRPVDPESVTFRSMVPTRDDVSRSWGPFTRGASVGSFFGTLPGTGGVIAAFMAYAIEKKLAREPSRFGKGAVEGVVAPETANNAADQTAFIPTLTLGVPGSPAMAIILTILIIHGLSPGPRFVTNQPDLFWGLIMSFWIGNIMLVILNIPLIGLWVRVISMPYNLMYPAILVFICVGVYSVSGLVTDIWFVAAFGALGYSLRLFGYSPAPMILGFVLGPMMEEYFRRALLISHGNLLTFFERPISATFMAISALLLTWSLWSSLRGIATKAPAV